MSNIKTYLVAALDSMNWKMKFKNIVVGIPRKHVSANKISLNYTFPSKISINFRNNILASRVFIANNKNNKIETSLT